MMNKYRGKIVQGDYIMRNIFHEKGGGEKKEKKESEEKGNLDYLRGVE